MKLTVVGCGDAFGSGGRLQTCYHLDTGDQQLLIDCGATSIIGLNRLGLDTTSIGTIVISHLHGDHFGGLVWWLLHSQHIAKRTVPLVVAGPPTIEARFKAAAEALFPGSTKVPCRFDLSFVEMTSGGSPTELAGARMIAYEGNHPSGAPSHLLRIETGGKVVAFTGDTEWVDPVVDCGRNADLYIMECFAFEGRIRYHMTWETISANLDRIGARKVMLTHMNAGMLASQGKVTAPGVIFAEDGLVIDV
jgi:ribonuclease BN (tRNA processing enzyme)